MTPKGRQADAPRTIREPRLLRLIALASVATVGWYAATMIGATPVVYAVPWAVHGAFFWLVVNFGLVMLAIGRVRSARYGPERRASVRFAVDLPGTYGGRHGRVLDLSLTGARIALDAAPVPGAGTSLATRVGDRAFDLACDHRSTRRSADGLEVGLQFGPMPTAERASLALALFRAAALDEALDVAAEPADERAAVPATPLPVLSDASAA